jgi:transketolase
LAISFSKSNYISNSKYTIFMQNTAQNIAKNSPATFEELANAIRALSMDAVEKAKSGHPGMPMGMADVATVLFSKFLKFDAKNPNWADRDRFILSAGHGSMLLYSLLYLTGYEDMTLEEIKNFRQFGAKTCGHPEFGHAAGIETTTGPLGQGIANSVGFAIAEKLLEARFGNDLVNHYTYVIAGDGCLMEGISQEAISLAGHLKLNKLIVLWDDNEISIDGPTSLSTSDDQLKRFEASNWNVCRINGHNEIEIEAAIAKAKNSDKPSLIACRTVIAKGAPTKAGKNSSHGSPLGADEIAGTRKNLDWNYAPFEIPEHILSSWRQIGAKNAQNFANWQQKLQNHPQKTEFERTNSGKLPQNYLENALKLKETFSKSAKMATRKSSQLVIEAFEKDIPEMLGGSADLTGSNLTKVSRQPVTPTDFNGSYIYYGIREHGMAAAMNGIALHGGFIPFGGTFLVFTDYCRPAIRLSALMHQRVIYVMTHDSIGLGEDGPTHQPIEHVASLRAIPNLYTFRPADATETLECWQLALENTTAPAILSLTRQDVANLRPEFTTENKSAKGAYAISEEQNPDVIIIGTGSEVEIAVKAKELLAEKGIKARVVSMPCSRLFDEQPAEYRQNLLGGGKVLRASIEAASTYGWDKYVGENGIKVGIDTFGASAPADKLYEHFGITAVNLSSKILKALGK